MKYRVLIQGEIETDADNAQTITRLLVKTAFNLNFDKIKVTLDPIEEKPRLCEDPEKAPLKLCLNCPNFAVAIDGGMMCEHTLKGLDL